MLRLNIITHNVWLIPFAGPWFLGRAERCAANMAAAVAKFDDEAEKGGGGGGGDAADDKTLTVVVLQEVGG